MMAGARVMLLLVLGLLLGGTFAQGGDNISDGCQRFHFGPQSERNIACRCNASHCDHLALEWPPANTGSGRYLRVRSDLAGARWASSLEAFEGNLKEDDSLAELQVDLNRRLQQVAGYGGAFTDSAAAALRSLPAEVRQRALEDYFGMNGLRYNLGRVPIGGTDMSWRPYSYDELDAEKDDFELERFKLQPEDLDYKLPLIWEANEVRSSWKQEPLKLMAASWSAPSWMKTNRALVQGRLRRDCYQAYARYVIRFLEEYARRNVSMWALSPQNEPHTPKRVGPHKINFNSVNFEPEEMADYLEQALVPQLMLANLTSDRLALYLWDDTAEGVAKYAEASLSRPLTSNFARGLAVHWYSSGLRGLHYNWLYELRRDLSPRYSLMSTEASFIGRPQPGAWWRGERYARDIMENLRAGSIAWIDWNLALNTSGGPSWSHNQLDAAILVDEDTQSYYKNPMFYSLAHVARFIPANSHLVQADLVASSSSSSSVDQLSVVAAEWARPEGKEDQPRRLALVLQNRNTKAAFVRLHLRGCRALEALREPPLVELGASSLTSLALNC